MELSMPEVIRKKRDGLELSGEEIKFFIDAVVNKKINECQTGAMLMAMFLKNLNLREVVDLTKSMIESGETLAYEKFSRDVLVDKHSTGGVGDKVSLILAPALAACGLKVPMVSGRGLGYTGGTLDKLESIPGFQVNLDLNRMNGCLDKAGCFICGATKYLAPADSELYRIRDITSTVENLSLVVPSILSKKAAGGAGTLVMDVKFGKGAVWKTEKEAEEVADMLIKVGEKLNLKIRLVISEMNVPLGRFVGNSLEVMESVMCLRNQVDSSLSELVKLLGGLILETKGLAKNVEEGKRMIQNTFKNNSALKCFQRMLLGQGVSEKNARELCAGNFSQILPQAPHVTLLESPMKGVVTDIDALEIGKACWHLGSGRQKAESKIDYTVGVILLKVVGDKVGKREPWIQVHHSTPKLPQNVESVIMKSLTVETDAKNIRTAIKTTIVK